MVASGGVSQPAQSSDSLATADRLLLASLSISPWTMARTPRRKQNWRLLSFHSIPHKDIQSGSRPANSPTFCIIKKEIGWRRLDKTPAARKMACKIITELAPRRKIARDGLIQFYICWPPNYQRTMGDRAVFACTVADTAAVPGHSVLIAMLSASAAHSPFRYFHTQCLTRTSKPVI